MVEWTDVNVQENQAATDARAGAASGRAKGHSLCYETKSHGSPGHRRANSQSLQRLAPRKAPGPCPPAKERKGGPVAEGAAVNTDAPPSQKSPPAGIRLCTRSLGANPAGGASLAPSQGGEQRWELPPSPVGGRAGRWTLSQRVTEAVTSASHRDSKQVLKRRRGHRTL